MNLLLTRLRSRVSLWSKTFTRAAEKLIVQRKVQYIADESLGPARPGEIRPPWIEYPGIAPNEFFWREAGQPWRAYVWQPYYNSLSEADQLAYRQYWKVPDVWWIDYFDPENRKFWESMDEPEQQSDSSKAE